MSNLLILGAGASYGSESDKSLVPPLAANLFEELVRYEPALWNQIPKGVADLYRSDFEQGWLALAQKAPGLQTVCQRSMAAFFYRYGPTRASLYARLANCWRQEWSGAVATLNYERMLPLALSRTNISAYCGPRPESNPLAVELCFPHGCCHIFCESVQGGADFVAMDGRAVSTNGPVKAIDEPREFWLRIKTQAFPPVMSYFEPSKFTTSGANFIDEQRVRLQELIKAADRIAIIGVAVREEDTHIWGALVTARGSIYYCSGKSAASTFEIWAQKNRSSVASDIISERYWADDFDRVNAHLNLSCPK